MKHEGQHACMKTTAVTHTRSEIFDGIFTSFRFLKSVSTRFLTIFTHYASDILKFCTVKFTVKFQVFEYCSDFESR
jgi:hypothetical protein